MIFSIFSTISKVFLFNYEIVYVLLGFAIPYGAKSNEVMSSASVVLFFSQYMSGCISLKSAFCRSLDSPSPFF